MNIIDRYFKNNKLIVIPRKEKYKIEIFEIIIGKLKDTNQIYFSEKELNEIIASFYDDYALIRRYLVDYGYLTRDLYGTQYKIKS